MWKENPGFARMALQHGATIVPVASLGADETFRILLDANDQMATPLGRLFKALDVRQDLLLPVPWAFRPQRFYFQFCEPITTGEFEEMPAAEALVAVLDRTRDAILDGIERLKLIREQDENRTLGGHALNTLRRLTGRQPGTEVNG